MELDRPRRRLASIPHKQVGDLRVVDVPAGRGIMAHKDYLASTACGEEIAATLVTTRDEHVRCAACKAAMTAGEFETEGTRPYANLEEPYPGMNADDIAEMRAESRPAGEREYEDGPDRDTGIACTCCDVRSYRRPQGDPECPNCGHLKAVHAGMAE